LDVTSEPPLSRQWRRERQHARQILAASQRPGYFELPDAPWDLDFLVDSIDDIRSGAFSPLVEVNAATVAEEEAAG
jgi:hypothetical protein